MVNKIGNDLENGYVISNPVAIGPLYTYKVQLRFMSGHMSAPQSKTQ